MSYGRNRYKPDCTIKHALRHHRLALLSPASCPPERPLHPVYTGCFNAATSIGSMGRINGACPSPKPRRAAASRRGTPRTRSASSSKTSCTERSKQPCHGGRNARHLLSEGGLERHGDPRGADCSKCAS